MPTEVQINANRENAKHSTGPVTPEGRAKVSQNPLEHGLFAKRDFVRPEEYDLYNAIAATLKDELDPGSLLESIHFAEALTATWRLQRCARLEAELADKGELDPQLDPEHRKLQQSIDRARTQSHNLLLKATKEIARLKKVSPHRDETEVEPVHETPVHETKEEILARIAARRAEKEAAAKTTEQTQSAPPHAEEDDEPTEQFLPYGQDPIDFEIEAAERALFQRLQASREAPISEQTQSEPRNTPRNSPCPCNSGRKYKRCCGFNQPDVIARAA